MKRILTAAAILMLCSPAVLQAGAIFDRDADGYPNGGGLGGDGGADLFSDVHGEMWKNFTAPEDIYITFMMKAGQAGVQEELWLTEFLYNNSGADFTTFGVILLADLEDDNSWSPVPGLQFIGASEYTDWFSQIVITDNGEPNSAVYLSGGALPSGELADLAFGFVVPDIVAGHELLIGQIPNILPPPDHPMVPEPSTLALLLLGVVGLAGNSFRRRKTA